MQIIKKIPLAIISIIIGVYIGINFSGIFFGNNISDEQEKILDVIDITNKYYVDSVNVEALSTKAIEGIMDELDPHSVYIPAVQQITIDEEFRGDFDGIGVEFQIINDTIVVVSPIAGGPSESVGIIAGDRIVKIDAKSCIGFDNSKVFKNLRGERGSSVNLNIFRPSEKKEIEFVVVRDKIPLHSVDVSLLYQDSIAYLSLSKFSETSTTEIIKSLSTYKNNAKYIILDLRNNSGGLLSQAINISDLFLDNNKMIVYTQGSEEDSKEEFKAEKNHLYEKTPLIILQNEGSASASEIVSGAMQDWDRALVVGETSFGKGLVQRPFILSDNSVIRITISKYYTPSGRAIQREFKSNKEDYYLELHSREENEGENYNHDSEQDSSLEKYFTAAGRVVYGGGGITPDYIVKPDSINRLTANIRRQNLYYKFIRTYLDKNRIEISEEYNSLEKFVNDFSFNKNTKNDFREFLKSNLKSFSNKDFNKHKNYIYTRLKAYVAREFWNEPGWYKVMLTTDQQFLKAVHLLDKSKEMTDSTLDVKKINRN